VNNDVSIRVTTHIICAGEGSSCPPRNPKGCALVPVMLVGCGISSSGENINNTLFMVICPPYHGKRPLNGAMVLCLSFHCSVRCTTATYDVATTRQTPYIQEQGPTGTRPHHRIPNCEVLICPFKSMTTCKGCWVTDHHS
jgi:hypothetical protein